MPELVEPALQYPTVLFSLLLGVVLIYWLFVLFGALDLDVLDFGGGFEGAGDAAVEGLGEGLAEGIGEGLAEAADGIGGDTDADVDLGDAHGGGVLAGVIGWGDISSVPLTVSASVIVLLSWLTSFVAVELVGPAATGLVWGSALVVGAGFVSLLVTTRVLRPFRGLFRTELAVGKDSLLGRTCEVTTLRVDERYGQAEVRDGGAGLLIQIRSSNASELERGSQALIFQYDARNDVFLVKPLGSAGALDADAR